MAYQFTNTESVPEGIKRVVREEIDGAIHDPGMSLKLLDALDRNAERLVHIVSDLLDLARLDAKQREMMEKMMKGQMERLEEMGNSGEMNVTVKGKELRVNS